MIQTSSQDSKTVKIDLKSLINDCNQRIIKEKEILYNFNFSAFSNENLSDNKAKENPQSKENVIEVKKEEKVVYSDLSNKPNQKIFTNIFKEKAKAFLKNKSFS